MITLAIGFDSIQKQKCDDYVLHTDYFGWNLLTEILFPFARYEVSFVKEEKINADIIHVLWNHNTNAI